MAEFIQNTLPDKKKRKKSKQKAPDILKKRYPHLPKDKLFGGQEVPMDIDAINRSMALTQKKE